VAELQAILARLGFSPGPVDGDFGYRTAEAVQQFQARQQLAVDGIVGPATWRALDHVLADPSQPAATNRSGASFVRYIVQPGDTLYLIARRYGMGMEEIVGANALPPPGSYLSRAGAGNSALLPVGSAGGSGTGTDAEANSRRTSFRCGGLLCGVLQRRRSVVEFV